MKITPEHLEHMQHAIQTMETKRPDGISITRHRWDMLHAAGLTPWVCSVVYPYANDAHIETALKHIIPE